MGNPDLIKKTDVVILCGGQGERLGAITRDIPKPMVSIGDRPFLDILMEYIISFGFERFILCVGYKKEAVESYFRKHKSGAAIVFSEEADGKLLGTGGAIKNAEGLIESDSFLVMNGDSFAPVDLGRFLDFHDKKKGSVSIALTKAAKRDDAGSVRLGDRDEIIGFSEKDGAKDQVYMNTGTYVFNKAIFGRIPPDRQYSLEYGLFPSMARGGAYGYVVDAELIDIGTPERLEKAKIFFAEWFKR